MPRPAPKVVDRPTPRPHEGTYASWTRLDGRFIERHPRICEHSGEPYYEFRQPPIAAIKAGPDKRPPDIGWASPRSPHAAFAVFQAAAGQAQVLEVHSHDALRAELKKFAADYPEIAAKLSATLPPLTNPFPGALFPTGPISFATALGTQHVFQADVLAFLKRHVAGDHGVYGSSVGVAPSEDDEECPPLAPIAVRNAIAIRDGRGLVVSRYATYDPAAERAWKESHHPTQAFPGRPDDFVEIVTVLGPKGATATASGRRCEVIG